MFMSHYATEVCKCPYIRAKNPMMTRRGAMNFFMAIEFNVTSSFCYAKAEMPTIQRQIQ